MNLNIENLVRSVVLLVVGLPVALGVAGTADRLTSLAEEAAASSVVDSATEEHKATLTEPCLRYVVSKADSKLERDAKNDIDDALGGAVMHGEVCKWVL
jgi:hypothetical protein